MVTRLTVLAAAAGAMAIAVASAAAQSGPPGSLRVAQGGSCQALFSQCRSRCAEPWRKEPAAKCVRDHCTPKLNTCRRTGCWTEGANYGGGTHCSLKKS